MNIFSTDKRYIVSYGGHASGKTLLYKIMNNQTAFDFKTEDQLQAFNVKWFDETYPEHRQMLFSIPNGANLPSLKNSKGQRYSVEANKLKATGLKSGVPDMCLLLFEGRCVWIEHKLPGETQFDEQIKFEERAKQRGHIYVLIYTHEQFKALTYATLGAGKLGLNRGI